MRCNEVQVSAENGKMRRCMHLWGFSFRSCVSTADETEDKRQNVKAGSLTMVCEKVCKCKCERSMMGLAFCPFFDPALCSTYSIPPFSSCRRSSQKPPLLAQHPALPQSLATTQQLLTLNYSSPNTTTTLLGCFIDIWRGRSPKRYQHSW